MYEYWVYVFKHKGSRILSDATDKLVLFIEMDKGHNLRESALMVTCLNGHLQVTCFNELAGHLHILAT